MYCVQLNLSPQERFHGAVFVSSVDDVLIPHLRLLILAWGSWKRSRMAHIDAFHKPESVVQRLTALYSPSLSHSTAATFTTETSLVDERPRTYFRDSESPMILWEIMRDA